MNQDDLSPEMQARAIRERQETRRRDLWTTWAMALIVLVGAIVRWWFIQTVNTQPVTDFHWYYQRAVEISQGQGYKVNGTPTAYWPVGWPGFLGLCFKVFGASVWTGKGVNFVLTLSAIPLTFALGLVLFRSRVTALLGALIVAVHPAFMAYSGILASEPLFTFLTLLGTLWLVKGPDRPTRWVLAGIAFGLACLVRPQAALLPPLILGCVWLWDSPWRRQFPFWRSFALTHAALGLVVAFWVIRCSVLMGGVFFVSTNGGDNLVIGAHDGATGRYVNPDTLRPANIGELERDKAARSLGMQWIVHHKRAWIGLAKPKLEEAFLAGRDVAYWGFQKEFGRLTAPGTGSDKALYLGVRDASVAVNRWLLYLSIFGLAAAIFGRFSRREAPALPMAPLAVIAASTLVVVLFFGNSRFILPIVPLLGLWAGHGPVCLVRFFTSLAPVPPRPEAEIDEPRKALGEE